jgi:phosphatidylcholine synthase
MANVRTSDIEPGTPVNLRAAWAVHIFTSTGILTGFLALLSVLDGSPRAALLWMMAAMIIDGLDGPMARKYDIERILPMVDGNALDLMIDYVCCVVTPAFFMHRFHLLPREYNLSLILIGLVLISSLYIMSSKDIETDDCYFNGFPAMWNLVVNVMFVLQAPIKVNVIITVAMVLITVIPLKFMHPVRTRDFRKITLPVLVVWLASMIYVTWILDDKTKNCASSCLPTVAKIAQGAVYVGSFWIVGVGIWRTIRGDPRKSSSST